MDAETLSSVSYGTILILLLLESTVVVGIFAPGVTAAVGGAYLAGVGALSPFGVFVVTYVGLFCGDCLGYGLGRASLTSKRITRLVDSLDRKLGNTRYRNSNWLVLFQFPFITRAPIPLLLGASRMSIARWLALDISATLLFSSSIFTLGYLAGRLTGDVDNASRNVAVLQGAFLGLLIAWAVFSGTRALVRRRRRATEN